MEIKNDKSYKKSTARLFIIVGNTPNTQTTNGKDLIIQAVDSMGSLHASIIPKYTSRGPKPDDGDEMICSCKFEQYSNGKASIVTPNGKKFKGDIVYERKGNFYGFSSKGIWEGLKRGKFQVVVISDAKTINKLREIFGGLVVLVYVHSHNFEAVDTSIDSEFELFSNNFDLFNHVLIYEDKAEDLYDQIFRLFRAYENGSIR